MEVRKELRVQNGRIRAAIIRTYDPDRKTGKARTHVRYANQFSCVHRVRLAVHCAACEQEAPSIKGLS